MVESLILAEFEEKDFSIYEQQILDCELERAEFERILNRVLKSKSKSLKDKVQLILQIGGQKMLDQVLRRAIKRYKTKLSLRYMYSEQHDMGD